MKQHTKLLSYIIFIISLCSNLNAASISGTIFSSNTTTPVTTIGNKILVEAYRTKCPQPEICIGWCAISPNPGVWVGNTGNYSIQGLDAGSYYLNVNATQDENYLSEWWATPVSVRKCDEAQEIIVSENEDKTGVNFNLDPGATITGTIFKTDGITPLSSVNITIDVISGSGVKLYSGYKNPNGDFSIVRIPTGKYYLEAVPSVPSSYNEIAYTREWWTNNSSSENFSNARLIDITEGEDVSGIFFQVDPLFKIMGAIFYDDGITQVRMEEKVKVQISKALCGEPINNFSAYKNGEGEYLIWNIPAGNYFIKAIPYGATRFQETWWNSTGSIYNCNSAQQIEVGSEEKNIFNKNFQIHFLEPFPWHLLLPVIGRQH